MPKFLRSIRIEEWVALASSSVVILINIFVYGNSVSGETAFRMLKYFSFGTRFLEIFFFFIWFACFYKIYIWLVRIAGKIFIEKETASFKANVKSMALDIFSTIRVLLPFVIVCFSFYQLLANFSYQFRFNTYDILLANWDYKIFGVYPFVWLPTVLRWEWFGEFMYAIYIYISIVLAITLILLFLISRNFLFRRIVLVFILTLMLAYPLFYFVPCQDPNNYFLRNIRGYSFSQEVSARIQNYSPAESAKGYTTDIATAETNEDRGDAVPISCFPSMHASWTFIIVYFLAQLSLWSLVVSLPWAVLLLLSGLYFSQHYAVDYIAAFLVVAISLFLANLLVKPRITKESQSIL